MHGVLEIGRRVPGRAVAVQKLPDNVLSTRFEVVEAFRGVSGPEVEVETGPSGEGLRV